MGEIQSLIDRAQTYLRSSQLLLEAGDFDSSVSRSYYAMFYLAEAALLAKGVAFSSHKAVITGFGEHLIKTGELAKDLGKELHRAFDKRQLSDYEFRSVITREEAVELLAAARRFVAAVVSHLQSKV
jgi:uncharacterized protein (UPF0332 family)